LLSRVRDVADEAAWREFQALYHDLLLLFCRRQGLQEPDAGAAAQNALGASRQAG
jgi:hypothetical protein